MTGSFEEHHYGNPIVSSINSRRRNTRERSLGCYVSIVDIPRRPLFAASSKSSLPEFFCTFRAGREIARKQSRMLRCNGPPSCLLRERALRCLRCTKRALRMQNASIC